MHGAGMVVAEGAVERVHHLLRRRLADSGDGGGGSGVHGHGVTFSWGLGGLQGIAGVGDENDEQARRLGGAGVAGQQVIGAGRLEPTLAGAIDPRRLSAELALDGSLQHIGVDEGLAVPVGGGPGAWREIDLHGREGLAFDIGQGPLEQRLQAFGRGGARHEARQSGPHQQVARASDSERFEDSLHTDMHESASPKTLALI